MIFRSFADRLLSGGRRWRRRHRRCWGDVEDLHPTLPITTLTNHNRCPIALGFDRAEVLALNSRSPFPVPPHFVASRPYKCAGHTDPVFRYDC
jgi:hypothetical protein